MNRTMKILFTVSVLLNLLLLGITGGMAAKSWHRHQNWHDMASGFSPEGQALVDEKFGTFRIEMKNSFEQSRALRLEMQKILAAPEFDARAFDRAGARMDRIRRDMGQRKAALIRELAVQLPPEDRKRLGERFMRPYGGYGGRFGESFKGKPPAAPGKT